MTIAKVLLAASLTVAMISFTAAAEAQPARAPVKCNIRPLMGDAPPPQGAALNAATPGTAVPMPLNTVNIISKSIRNKVIVQGVSATRTETGTMSVTVQLLNCTDHPLQVQSRAQFFGAGNVTNEQPSAWKRSFLPPRSVTGFNTSSLGAKSESFLVEVQEGT